MLVSCSSPRTTTESSKPSPPPDDKEARELFARAAGVDWKTLEEIGKASTPPRLDQLADVPLTMLVLTHEHLDKAKDFKILADPLEVTTLVARIAKSKHRGFGSVIQPEFITRYAFVVEGAAARGTISFKATGAYEGTVDFTGKYVDGTWEIDEFRLPNDKIGVRRGGDGKWRKFGPA
jgi:hypothetical protein